MLFKNLVKKAKDNGAKTGTGTGVCRFCGQVAAYEVLPEWTQDEIDELAVEYCQCEDACNYTETKERKEIAEQKIGEMFGEGNGVCYIDESTLQLLYQSAGAVCECKVRSVTIDIGSVKAKFALNKDDKVKVTRTITKTDSRTI